MLKTSVLLTDEELVCLDGNVSPEVQELVNAAKARLDAIAQFPTLPAHLASFVGAVRHEAETRGMLIFRRTGLRLCSWCGKSVPITLGRSKRKRATTMPGVELAHRTVSVVGYPTLGCCDECFSTAQDALRVALKHVIAELPAILASKEAPKYVRREAVLCAACGWTGHEGEMRQLKAILGGTYPGGCPACPAENAPFGRTKITRTGGFTVCVE